MVPLLSIYTHYRLLVWVEGELYPGEPAVVIGGAGLASDNQVRIEIHYLCSKHPYLAYRHFKMRASPSDGACYGVAIGAIVVFESY